MTFIQLFVPDQEIVLYSDFDGGEMEEFFPGGDAAWREGFPMFDDVGEHGGRGLLEFVVVGTIGADGVIVAIAVVAAVAVVTPI